MPNLHGFLPTGKDPRVVVLPALWEGNGAEGELHNPADVECCGQLV